ncbi:MAG: CBS domain-containing protein [Candidatus Saganbacteria bacterium]|nr:CBS domain-containing protein [Candidatus Saganbacteria bacterium]
MELFLDSVNFEEIEAAAKLGILTGLTTTPTFMYRHGITDIDAAIVKLSGMVPSLHVEALGESYDEIIAEAHRIKKLPLKKQPVFKIPVSTYGVRACRTLVDEGCQVNIHLVYTLNQAWTAMMAGATYICPLVGRLHDQGHDAMALIEQAVKVVDHYGYKTKIMVSSVRHPEHVRQGLLLGAHACTVPWSVLKRLPDNALTTVGTEQFLEHTKLMTVKVKDAIRGKNPVCKRTSLIMDAIAEMTESRLGAVSVVDDKGQLIGIFTDGDIRRQLKEKGKDIVNMKMSEFKFNKPVTLSAEALLHEAVDLFSKHEYDNIIVTENNKPVGMLDIQDFVKMKLLG